MVQRVRPKASVAELVDLSDVNSVPPLLDLQRKDSCAFSYA